MLMQNQLLTNSEFNEEALFDAGIFSEILGQKDVVSSSVFVQPETSESLCQLIKNILHSYTLAHTADLKWNATGVYMQQ